MIGGRLPLEPLKGALEVLHAEKHAENQYILFQNTYSVVPSLSKISFPTSLNQYVRSKSDHFMNAWICKW